MTQRNWPWEAKQLLPHLVDLLGGRVVVQAGGGGLVAHALNSTTWHTGTLNESQAPWAVTTTVYDAHVANANAHHNKATAANTEIAVSDPQVITLGAHDIVARHAYSGGANLDVFGLSGPSTIARLTPSADVSAGGTAILRSNAGLLALKNINVNSVLQSDSLNYVLGVNVAPDGAAALDIRAGATSDHSLRIKQIAAQTGRLWRIENTSGQELIVLDSVGDLQSGNPGFTSGLSGWQLTPGGNAEFNNGRFRGELHATVMVFDEVSARNGTELVTPAGGALELDVTITNSGAGAAIRNVRTTAFGDQDYLDYRTDSGTGSGTGITARTIENILSVKNPDTGHYQVFRAGEALRMKVWTGSAVTDTWLRVNSALDMGTYYAYFVEVMSGSLPVTYRAGSAAAGYGRSGEGAIRLSADDPYGPLIDIFTRGDAPWAGDIYPHVRLGRLDGVGVPGLSGIPQYGIALGTNLADATKPYMYASNLGVRQYNISSAWSDGANDTVRIEAGGRARFGTNVDSPANTFLDINPALGLATFRGVAEFLAGSTGLDNIADGATYAKVNSAIISGGNIRVGSGTKDSTLNGWNIDSGEIVGQASGVDQVVMGTDGAIGFAGGTGHLSGSGLSFDSASTEGYFAGIRFINSSAEVAKFTGWGTASGYGYAGVRAGQSFPNVNDPTPTVNSVAWLKSYASERAEINIDAWSAQDNGASIQLINDPTTGQNQIAFIATNLYWGSARMIGVRTTAF